MLSYSNHLGLGNEKDSFHIVIFMLVISDVARRSFATNHYGKIPTPILMKLTGHSRESTFLEYVGKNANMDTYADILMDALSK